MDDISTYPLWARSMIANADTIDAARSGGYNAAAMVKRYAAEIRADPPKALHTFRGFYNSRTPLDWNLDLVQFSGALQSELKLVVYNGGVPGLWRKSLDSGLPELCIDIISEARFFDECPLWRESVLESLVCIIAICLAEPKSPKNVVMGNKIIDKSSMMWESMWKQREAINRKDIVGDGDTRLRSVIPELLLQIGEMYQLWNRFPNMRATHLSHLSFFLWYNTPLGEEHRTALLATVWYTSHEKNNVTVQRLVKESAVDTVGPDALLERFHRDLDDDALVDDDLSTCLHAMTLFVSHEEVFRLVGPFETYKHIFTALDRQKTKGKREYEFKIVSRASPVLDWSSTRFPPSMCLIPMLEKYDLVGLMARGAVLCVENNCNEDNTGACVSLIENHSELLGSPLLPAGKNRWTHLVKSATRRDWYPTLLRLRELRPKRGAIPPAYTRLLRAWEKFGERARMDEGAEKERFERAKAKKAKWCAWKGCEYNEREPEKPMLQCAGCHKLRYCDRVCQKRDWKEGGHKTACST
ncbi:hypothetical protein OF83DRAFT_1158642 [Amylostereum chailletii]|nr:hypothetical protein OF83DRAFT_1158642 [Amylostereum chailletii]